MIKPHKYMNLNISILKISSLILKDLLKKRIVRYSELYEKLEKKYKNDLFYVFPLALSFLYLQKTIMYHPINDSFEFIGRKEAYEAK